MNAWHPFDWSRSECIEENRERQKNRNEDFRCEEFET